MADAPVVFITGGNTGLGLATVHALYAEPRAYEIVIGSRVLSDGEDAIAALEAEYPDSPSRVSAVQIDVTSDASITAARDELTARYGRVNVLVHNAGVNLDREIQAKQLGVRAGWARAWDVNVVGAHVLTTELVPLLLAAAEGSRRLLFVTSGTSALADTERMDRQYATINAYPPAGWPKPDTLNPTESYRSTKAGLNMLMRQWHRILKNDGVQVFGVSPGFLATGLAGIGRETLTKVRNHVPR